MIDLNRFRDQIRVLTLKTLIYAKGGHIGGSMSIVETLAVVYGKHMHIDPMDPKSQDRDWFILSKGHSGPAYYATLSLLGFFDESWLYTLNQDNTNLPSHPDSLKTPGVDCTTGSLGQGISQAVGVAMAFKNQSRKNMVYTLVGDGESNEGQVWEAFQFAVGHQLSNLIIFIDNNKNQLDGKTKDINVELDFHRICEAYGFYTQSVNGKDLHEIDQAINNAKANKGTANVIVLNTIKGQGVPFIEEMTNNHHIAIDETMKEKLLTFIKQLEDSYD